jgi:hypothetical protein
MKIGEIREVINRAGYMRNDLSGHTRDEFLHRDVPAWLEPQIEALRALEIAPRFRIDEERRQYEIERLRAVIDRWRGLQISERRFA